MRTRSLHVAPLAALSLVAMTAWFCGGGEDVAPGGSAVIDDGGNLGTGGQHLADGAPADDRSLPGTGGAVGQAGGSATGGDASSPPSDVVFPPAKPGEWVQHAHDAQRSGYTEQTVALPWQYRWQWNGADATGKKQAGHLGVPDMAQPVTGGEYVYIAANNAVHALKKTDGTEAWATAADLGTLSSTALYDNGRLFVASENGKLYRLNAASGQTDTSYTADGALGTAPLLAKGLVIVGSANGTVYAVDPSTMQKKWEYAAGSPVVTPPSFSEATSRIVVVTQDLNVHAIDADLGNSKWKRKPTTRAYEAGTPGQGGAQADQGWPVIADGHGIVLVRYRLDWNTLWGSNPFPSTNAAIVSFLTSNPTQQALFALNLSDGTPAFVPAVGNGGAGDGDFLPMGPQPIVRVVGGKEVAYTLYRNGLTCGGCAAAGDCNGTWCDGREDTTMGELVLDGSTVAGYEAGHVRFVGWVDIQSDEQMAISGSGDVLFHSHWLVNEAYRIKDRTDARGSSFKDPISTVAAPFVIWRQCYCPPTDTQCNPIIYPGGSGTTSCGANCAFNATTRHCPGGLFSYGDQRGFPAGFYEYHNDKNDGSKPATIVSDGLVLVKANDGGLLAFASGDPTFGNAAQSVPATASPMAAAPASPLPIANRDAVAHLGQAVLLEGTITSAVDHRPKALYLTLRDASGDDVLFRVFEKDLARFTYDPLALAGRTVRIVGRIGLFEPEMKKPHIVVTDPGQLEAL